MPLSTSRLPISTRLTKRRQSSRSTPMRSISVKPQAFPTFQLPFQAKTLFAFLASLSLSTPRNQLVLGVGSLKFLDRLEHTLELLLALDNLLFELVVDLITTFDLCCQITNGAINVALGPLRLGFDLFEFLQLIFKLHEILVAVRSYS